MDPEIDLEDGQVHFTVLPGSLDKNRHLIGRALCDPRRRYAVVRS